MNDLISRQAAIEHLKKRLYETALNNYTEHPDYEEMADNRVSVWLEEVPTVDAVPVVRCKDCKHSELWYSDRRRCFLWCETGNSVFDDGYCSYGERSEE